MPALVFYKSIITSQVHVHRLATDGTSRDEVGRDSHILLCFHHFFDNFFVIVGLPVAGLGALEKTIVALSVEKPLFVEARLLEAVVDVGRKDEVVFIFDELK